MLFHPRAILLCKLLMGIKVQKMFLEIYKALKYKNDGKRLCVTTLYIFDIK